MTMRMRRRDGGGGPGTQRLALFEQPNKWLSPHLAEGESSHPPVEYPCILF
jgi:hypothetical protein